MNDETNSPQGPGGAIALAAFAAAQAALVSANLAYEAARTTCQQKMLERDAALATWQAALGILGAVTELGTAGEAAAIVSAGFGVRTGRTPTADLPAPTNMRAETNGTPGHTTVSCDPLATAKSCIVQKTTNPDAEDGWRRWRRRPRRNARPTGSRRAAAPGIGWPT